MTAELTTEMRPGPVPRPTAEPTAGRARRRLAAVPDPQTTPAPGPGWVPGSELGCTKRERRQVAPDAPWDERRLEDLDDN